MVWWIGVEDENEEWGDRCVIVNNYVCSGPFTQ